MDETRRLIERARRSAEEARRVALETRQLVQTSREIQHWTARVQGRLSGEAGRSFSFHRGSNALLALLPTKEFEHLAPQLQGVAFARNEVLHRANAAVDYLYFPITGLLSATITIQDGCGIEIAPIGSEGMAGLLAYVGDNISPHDVIVQIPGHGLRIAVTAFRKELKRGGLLQDIVTGYLSACATLSAQQIACNGLHKVHQRCCRRLLTTQDRIGSEVLPLTHEALAQALGVRRASVTDELGSLQKHGVIEYQRGQIKILSRRTLQSLACECYQADREVLSRLFGKNAIGAGL